MISRFPPPACVPACRTLVARGNAITKRTGFPPRPAAFPTIDRGRSPGSWDRCVSPSRELALPVAGPRIGRKASDPSRWFDTPAPLTVAGAAEVLEGLGTADPGKGNPSESSILNPLPHLFPVSPRREV